jgi:hypothetical protein
MSYNIRKINGATNTDVTNALREIINLSRFTAEVETHKHHVSIHKIRLRKSKDYCGNHPNACPVRPTGPKPHRHSTCLEGTDWVSFNDMVNNILDQMNVSANVASSLCIVRKGALRRNEYHGHTLGNGIDREWDRDTTPENYVDNKGKPPIISDYPKDTPGILGM